MPFPAVMFLGCTDAEETCIALPWQLAVPTEPSSGADFAKGIASLPLSAKEVVCTRSGQGGGGKGEGKDGETWCRCSIGLL